MANLNLDKDTILNEIYKTLGTVIRQFYYNSHLFFNESGFQHYFFAVFYRNKYFSTSNRRKTSDGKRTNLLHTEYMSVKKTAKKDRASYDIVILNPSFIERSDYARVRNKLLKHTESKPCEKDDLLAVFELKFADIETKSAIEKCIKGVEHDYKKLREGPEILVRFIIVFSLIKDDNKLVDFLKNLSWNDGLRLIYVKVHSDNKGRNHADVLIKPDNFINLKPTSGISVRS